MAVNWEDLLSVDAQAVAKLFVAHAASADTKLRVRGYSIPFTGTQQRVEDLTQALRRQLIKYVFPESERPDDIDWALARDKFGDIDPESDGKLGEMLLYVFVEAYLKTPLMAYKLKDLGNPNDQVKGADGVFVGEYAGQAALLIGESKIHQSLSSAVSTTLASLHRFHERSGTLTNELTIAKKYPKQRALSGEVLQAVDNLFTGKTDRILIHPVFISYTCAEIASICTSATCAANAEAALAAYIIKEAQTWSTAIDNQKTTYGRPFQVYLDFFFLPAEDCLALRNAFYEMLHGHPWDSSAVKAAVARTKKEFAKPKPAARRARTAAKSSGGAPT